MPIARVNGIELYYEESGRGFPLVWSHEFGGDHRSWEPQVRYFSRRYRVITYNHRGFPPSEVPADPAAYSNLTLVEDLHQLLRHLGVDRAHVGGLSMGGNVALNFGIQHPEVAASLIVAGCGSGTVDRERFVREYGELADEVERRGIGVLVERFGTLATRQVFRAKDPRGWEEFLRYLGEHSAAGSANLIRGVILRRRTIFDLELELQRLRLPTLVLVGDQDEPCIEPGLFMRRHLPHAGLAVLPVSGHTINIEEPALFNLHVTEFLTAVENGSWGQWQREAQPPASRAP
jgi:pimeloyl-ACP methyl ester carboxylesterase